ncbi:hypothetical protein LEMLEM_LOCUS18068, partial [Lemmus lemmus]
WRTLKSSSGCQPRSQIEDPPLTGVRDTQHFHATNTGQEQRPATPGCGQHPAFSTPPPKTTSTNQQEAVLRIRRPNS